MFCTIILDITYIKLCKGGFALIKREMYLSKIRNFYDSELIKVITGIRRCGKSVLMNQIIEEIKQKHDNR